MPCYDESKIQRSGRTSRVVIFLRASIIGAVLIWFIFRGWAGIIGRETLGVSPFMCYVLSVAILLSYGTWTWIGSTLLHSIIYGRDPWYHYYRSLGWSPFWDTLPWPFNPDSKATRYMGLKEPIYTSFVPPPEWEHQCPVCGARVGSGICWNCNYGADGDSTVYYQRFGQAPDAPPPPNHHPYRHGPVHQSPDFPFPREN